MPVSLHKDCCGGALMLLLGAGVAWRAREYGLGSLREMDAGSFPFALGVLLALIGLVLVVKAPRTCASAPKDKPGFNVRRPACIAASVAAFVVVGRYGGLVPASFAIVFLSALGERGNGWRATLTLSVVMTAVSVVVFWWGLQLQFPLFNWG